MNSAERFPSYRAPRINRQILCVPPWSSVTENVATQRAAINNSTIEIAGFALRDLAREARSTLVNQAHKYTNSYTEADPPPAVNRPLILTGHQPELIHPGVWMKNFAAVQLAKATHGSAINLIIDSDLCRNSSIRVPTGTVERPQVVDVPFDQAHQQVPWEDRHIVDRTVWQSFGDRVTGKLAPLVSNPMVREWWPEVVRNSASILQVGLCVAQSRHKVEQQWGAHGLELPQSQVCQTPAFRRFAFHLLVQACKLRGEYNKALTLYRDAHHLRNPAQPLPDLSEVDGWTETPFWIWQAEEPERRALYVRSGSGGLQLTDRAGWQELLPGNADSALLVLADWEARGVRIRSRALITTLFARLLLADVFIHGIGGAKYDQVTDLLCQGFFGIELPHYVTVSATLQLPIDHEFVAPGHLQKLRQDLREVRFHPEARIRQAEMAPTHHADVEALITQKQLWVRTAKTPQNAAERHAQIVAANNGLQAYLQEQQAALERELAFTITQSRANRILESREYPFCLFPANLLRDFLLDF